PRATVSRSAATCSRWATPSTSTACSTPCDASTPSTTCTGSTPAERRAQAGRSLAFAGEVAGAFHRLERLGESETAAGGEGAHDPRLVVAEVVAEARQVDRRAQGGRDARPPEAGDVFRMHDALDDAHPGPEGGPPARVEVDEELLRARDRGPCRPDPGRGAERRDEARGAVGEHRRAPGGGVGRAPDGHVDLREAVALAVEPHGAQLRLGQLVDEGEESHRPSMGARRARTTSRPRICAEPGLWRTAQPSAASHARLAASSSSAFAMRAVSP